MQQKLFWKRKWKLYLPYFSQTNDETVISCKSHCQHSSAYLRSYLSFGVVCQQRDRNPIEALSRQLKLWSILDMCSGFKNGLAHLVKYKFLKIFKNITIGIRKVLKCPRSFWNNVAKYNKGLKVIAIVSLFLLMFNPSQKRNVLSQQIAVQFFLSKALR